MSRSLHYASGILMATLSGIMSMDAHVYEPQLIKLDAPYRTELISRAGTTKLNVNITASSPFVIAKDFYLYDKSDPKSRYGISGEMSISTDVPSGQYFIAVGLWDMGTDSHYLIVRDNVDITGETVSLNIDQSEAKNLISYKMLLPNGELVEIDEQKDNWVTKEGNAENAEAIFAIFRENGYLMRAISVKIPYANTWWDDNDHQYTRGDVYVSDLPEDCVVYISHRTLGKDHSYYWATESIVGGVTESKELTTDTDKYHKIENNFSSLPEEGLIADGPYYGYAQTFLFNSRSCDGLGGRIISTKATNTCYVNLHEPSMERYDAVETNIMAAIAAYDNGMEGASRDFYTLTTPPTTIKEGKVYRKIFHSTVMGNANTPSFPDGGPKFTLGAEYAYHPRFSWFEEEAPDAVFGGNTPIAFMQHKYNASESNPQWTTSYYGRYGENRHLDLEFATAKAELNGNVAYEGGYNDFQNWTNKYYQSNSRNDKLVATLVNNHTLVDDATATNTTVMTIPGGNDDCLPPTLTMLNFRDRNDIITDRFDKSTDGVLEFSATDLTYRINDSNYGWYECVKLASVKVEYAADGDEYYYELPVEEVEDMFFSPGYGQFFRVPLSAVKIPSPTGWYNLRLTVADNAGNTQQQTLTSAFSIKELTSITDTFVDKTATAVTVDNGVISICGDKNASVSIYSVDGKKVMQFSGTSADVSSLSGLYIVEVNSSRSGRTTVKVVI